MQPAPHNIAQTLESLAGAPGADAIPPAALKNLLQRMGETHLRARLNLDAASTPTAEGKGGHTPSWVRWLHKATGAALWLMGLRQRTRENLTNFRINHHNLPIANLPGALQGLRILHLGDVHIDFIPENATKLIEFIKQSIQSKQLIFDAVVHTGDFRDRAILDNAPSLQQTQQLTEALNAASPENPVPKFAVLGNHDALKIVPPIESMGWNVLLNEHATLTYNGATLYIAGVDDTSRYQLNNVSKATRGIPENAPTLHLAHSPHIAQAYNARGIRTVLCGHTHGGQICLPTKKFSGTPIVRDPAGFGKKARSKLSGPWKHGTLHGYTTNGAGACGMPARLNCPPELVVHTLVPLV